MDTKDPSPPTPKAEVLFGDRPRLGASLNRAGRFLGNDQELQGLLSSADQSVPQNN